MPPLFIHILNTTSTEGVSRQTYSLVLILMSGILYMNGIYMLSTKLNRTNLYLNSVFGILYIAVVSLVVRFVI